MKRRATVPPMKLRCVSVRVPENLNRRCTLTLSPSGGDNARAEPREKHPTMRQTSGRVTQTHILFDTVHSVEVRNSFPQLTGVTACLIWVSEKQRARI